MLQLFILPTTLLIGASIWDLKSRKVPNSFVVGSLVFSVAYILWLGSTYIPSALFGFLTGFAILLPLYVVGAIGAGDVKVFSIFGLLTNSDTVISVFIFSLIFGAAVGLIKAILDKKHNSLILNLKNLFLLKKPDPSLTTKIPFTIALLLGWASHIIYTFYGRVL